MSSCSYNKSSVQAQTQRLWLPAYTVALSSPRWIYEIASLVFMLLNRSIFMCMYINLCTIFQNFTIVWVMFTCVWLLLFYIIFNIILVIDQVGYVFPNIAIYLHSLFLQTLYTSVQLHFISLFALQPTDIFSHLKSNAKQLVQLSFSVSDVELLSIYKIHSMLLRHIAWLSLFSRFFHGSLNGLFGSCRPGRVGRYTGKWLTMLARRFYWFSSTNIVRHLNQKFIYALCGAELRHVWNGHTPN